MHALIRLALLAAAIPCASAQETRVFELDPMGPDQTVHWTAESNLGPMNAFLQSYTFSGDISVDFTQNPNTGMGRITGARMRIPNSVVAANQSGPGGVVLWLDLVLDMTSPEFPIFGALPFPSFSTTVDLTVSSGFVQVDPPFGPAFLAPIDGLDLGAIQISGRFPSIGPVQTMVLDPFQFEMPFSAPGFNGEFTHDVPSLVMRQGCPAPVAYCGVGPGPGPFGALLGLDGSTSVAADDVTLRVFNAPVNTFGVFFYGQRAARIPNGMGDLCIGGPLVRIDIVGTDAAGNASLDLPLMDYQTGPGAITPGSHHNFQFWHRQMSPAGPSWSFSTALAVTFCP